MDEKINLSYPIDVDGRKIDHITIRRPRVRDIQQVEMGGGDEFTKSVKLIANLTMLTPDQVLDLDMGSDFLMLRNKVNDFLGVGNL